MYPQKPILLLFLYPVPKLSPVASKTFKKNRSHNQTYFQQFSKTVTLAPSPSPTPPHTCTPLGRWWWCYWDKVMWDSWDWGRCDGEQKVVPSGRVLEGKNVAEVSWGGMHTVAICNSWIKERWDVKVRCEGVVPFFLVCTAVQFWEL